MRWCEAISRQDTILVGNGDQVALAETVMLADQGEEAFTGGKFGRVIRKQKELGSAQIVGPGLRKVS